MIDVRHVYNTLCKVYVSKCYIGEAVGEDVDFYKNNGGSLRAVYGTVEHSFLFDYHISLLCDKKPKTAVAVLLKIAMYCIRFMDDCKTEIVVDAVCKTAKQVGKAAVVGYINAVLRRYESVMNALPDDELSRLSVTYNRPVWLVKRYIAEYGYEGALEIFKARGTTDTHIRWAKDFGRDALVEYLDCHKVSYRLTDFGVLLGDVSAVSALIRQGKCTVQSLSSIRICRAFDGVKGRVLDACAAPGGKSVYLAEHGATEVVACDVYPHRLQLVKKYAERMGVNNVVPTLCDAAKSNAEFVDAFDAVLLDVPCSNFGALPSNPDVVLHRTEQDVENINRTQRAIIANCAAYVRQGGKLVYSTCSDCKAENGDVVREFLKNNAQFELLDEKQLCVDDMGGEGYYFATLIKK